MAQSDIGDREQPVVPPHEAEGGQVPSDGLPGKSVPRILVMGGRCMGKSTLLEVARRLMSREHSTPVDPVFVYVDEMGEFEG